MRFAEGRVKNLLELSDKFIEFVSDPSDIDYWEVVRKNTDSFFGTTFKAKGIDEGGYVYLSILFRNIVKGKSYKEWYDTKYLTENYVHTDKDVSLGSVNGIPDIFTTSGQFLSFNVHKQFDDELWLCEQGGAYCPTGDELNLLPLSEFRTFENGSAHQGFFNPPPYPSTGSPLLTVSNNDLASSDIKYYLHKGKNFATITIQVVGCWQSISFGLLDGVDYRTYKFPAFIAGGSTGFTNTGWVYLPYNGQYMSYSTGNMISLDIKSMSLANGTIPNATKFNNGRSNAVIMNSEGIWEDFYNYTQKTDVMPYYSYNQPISNWGFALGNPTRITGNGNRIFPSCSDFDGITDISAIDASSYDVFPFLYPLMFVRDVDQNRKGIIGFIPNHYVIYSKRIKEGIAEIQGKKYLIIPNGWEDRVRYLPSYVGVHNLWNNAELLNIFTETTKNKFCKLAIKMED